MPQQGNLAFEETDEAQPVISAGLRPIDLALAAFLQKRYPTATAAHCQLAALVSYQLAQGHLCLPLSQLPTAAKQIGWTWASPYLTDNPLVSDTGATPLVQQHDRLYLQRYWQLEVDIARAIATRLATSGYAAADLADDLNRLFSENNVSPDWQKIACALACRSGIGIITGGPGTGKTTTVVNVLALIQQQRFRRQQRPLHIRLAAPTGKAAARLTDSITQALDKPYLEPFDTNHLPRHVITLHRLLGSRHNSRHFRHHADNPLAADLVVVDEASMVDIDTMHALLMALPAHCQLLLVGDKDQLASVEAGAVMASLCDTADQAAYTADTLTYIAEAGCHYETAPQNGSRLAQHTTKLRKNWRADGVQGIIKLADAINQQDAALVEQTFATYPDTVQRHPLTAKWRQQHLVDSKNGIRTLLHHMHDTRPTTAEGADAWAKTLLEKLANQQLITPLRHGPDGLEALNQQITDVLFRQQLIDNRQWYAGQPLLITQNLYDLGLMNGDMGITLLHPTLGLRVAFIHNKTIRWVLPQQLETRSQGGWAISVHQSQGSEYDRVLLHMPSQLSPVLCKELLYTAVTRAKSELILLESDSHIFQQALQQRTQRYSGLSARLAAL